MGLQPKEVNGTMFNQLPASAYTNVPKPVLGKAVILSLHPRHYTVIGLATVDAPTDEARELQKETVQTRHGQMYFKLSGEYFCNDEDDEENFGKTFPIGVFEPGAKAPAALTLLAHEHNLTFTPGSSAFDTQLWYFIHVCGWVKTSLSKPEWDEWRLAVVDVEASIKETNIRNRSTTSLKNLIMQTRDDDEQRFISMAKDLGYSGFGSGEDAENWMLALAEDSTKETAIRSALENTDVAGLLVNIRKAIDKQIIAFDPQQKKMAFTGNSGFVLVSSTQNEDQEARVQKIGKYMLAKGQHNMEALGYLTSALEAADKEALRLAGQ